MLQKVEIIMVKAAIAGSPGREVLINNFTAASPNMNKNKVEHKEAFYRTDIQID